MKQRRNIATPASAQPVIQRRELLQGTAALIVGVAVPSAAIFWPAAAMARTATRPLNPAELDSWLAISANGEVTGYWGKMDMGQGVDTAIAQIIAEELDVTVDRVNIVISDSALCVNQGGASGSSGVNRSGAAFRAAAAEARLALLEKAAVKLDAPVSGLDVRDGVIYVTSDSNRSISYFDLIKDRLFDTPVQWNGKLGNGLVLDGRAQPKDPKDYRIVGTSVPRKDLPGKILASTEFLQDVRVPGMLHGRMIRPKLAGARLRGVNKASVKDIPDVQIVVEKDFIGVVAPNEWDAIKAARQLEVDWDETAAGFPTDANDLFDYIRGAEAAESSVDVDDGNVDVALSSAARVLSAEFEWPFQSHARMAPATALADVRDSDAVVWTDSQKSYDTRDGAKKLLESPIGVQRKTRKDCDVRSIWKPGPGSYGRSDAGDGAMDAVVLSAAVGAPVRVQWMRYEGHAWDPKGPASVLSCKASLDAAGNVTGYHFHIKGFSRADQKSRESAPGEVLAGHLLGHKSTPEWTMQTPAESYRFTNKRYSWDAIAPLRLQASPLRTAHFRDPYGPEVHFASESFVDEMAFAAGFDPLAFRLKYVGDDRDAAVLQAAAELAGWEARSGPRRQRDSHGNYIGTGIAYAQRNGSVNAIVAEVEVNPGTGRVWVRRFFVGSDHGLIINPFTLDRVIEGNLLQATSRTLFEEVSFDRDMVTSKDWQTYPILESIDAPLDIQIKKINRPELGPRGAGEPLTRVVSPAIANAFFDATGVRLRRVPFSKERVKAALRAK